MEVGQGREDLSCVCVFLLANCALHFGGPSYPSRPRSGGSVVLFHLFELCVLFWGSLRPSRPRSWCYLVFLAYSVLLKRVLHGVGFPRGIIPVLSDRWVKFAPICVRARVTFRFVTTSRSTHLRCPFRIHTFRLLRDLPNLFLFHFHGFIQYRYFLGRVRVIGNSANYPIKVTPLCMSHGLMTFKGLLFFFAKEEEKLLRVVGFEVVRFLGGDQGFQRFHVLVGKFICSRGQLYFLFKDGNVALFCT